MDKRERNYLHFYVDLLLTVALAPLIAALYLVQGRVRDCWHDLKVSVQIDWEDAARSADFHDQRYQEIGRARGRR